MFYMEEVMPQRDGRSKFYRGLNLPKEVKRLMRMYNYTWKKEALSKLKGCSDGAFGKLSEEK